MNQQHPDSTTLVTENLPKLINSLPLDEVSEQMRIRLLEDYKKMRSHSAPPETDIKKLLRSELSSEVSEESIRSLTKKIESVLYFEITESSAHPALLEHAGWTTPGEAIGELTTLARLGNEDAIRELAYLGSSISNELVSLANLQLKKEKSSQENKTTKSLKDIVNSSDLNDIIDALEKTPPDQREQLKKGLSVAIDSFPEADGNYARMLDLLPNQEDVFRASEPPSLKNLTIELCDRLIQQKIDKECSSALKRVAQDSECWPVSLPAVTDLWDKGLKDYLANIHLGEDLSIQLNPRRQKRADDINNLTLDLFLTLNKERKLSETKSKTHLEEWQKDEDERKGISSAANRRAIRYTTPTAHPSILEYKSLLEYRKAYEDYVATKEKENSEWNVENVWMRKAALLPALSEESAGKWAEAAMAYIARECNQDYDEYPWPKAVTQRQGKKGMSSEAAGKEQLEKSFKRLAAKPKPPEE